MVDEHRVSIFSGSVPVGCEVVEHINIVRVRPLSHKLTIEARSRL